MTQIWQKTEHGPLPSNPARQLSALPSVRILAYLAINIIAAVAMERSSLIATALAFLTIGAGLFFLVRDKTPERMVYVTGYIVGVEVIWRGTGASVFWEMGKYAVVLLLGLSMIKHRRFSKAPKLPLFYFLLLIPSIVLLPSFDREAIAFNLSGPLALVVSLMYFDNYKLTLAQLRRLLLAVLGPIVGLAFLASFLIVTAQELIIQVGGKATSAGIGPNQVSSILGLGVVAAFFLAFLYRRQRSVSWMMIFITIWLLAQAALTLSRGGVWSGFLAISVGGVLLARDRRLRGIIIAAVVLTFIILNFFALPLMDDFTGGIVSSRLQDFDLTGRDEIVLADWQIFQQHPLFGVGPGQSEPLHSLTFRLSAAHVEYTRLLAEHGSLGAMALFLLVIFSIRILSRPGPPLSKAFSAAGVTYALTILFHSAMRLAAPAYMFGLAAASLVLDAEDEE